jgi:hypothetical protein
MKVTYNLPPEVVFAIEGHANQAAVSVDEYVARYFRETVIYPSVRDSVADLVKGGATDADIAATLRYSPGRIATIRRSLGLPPNKR